MNCFLQVPKYSARRLIIGGKPATLAFRGAYLKSLSTRSYSRFHRCSISITNNNTKGVKFGLKKDGFHPMITAKRFESITSSTTGQKVPDSVLNLNPTQYRHLADETLDTIATDLEDLFEDKGIADADVDNSAGIVTISTSRGTYVINKQPPNKQIWLSSPISGPKRFDYIKGLSLIHI